MLVDAPSADAADSASFSFADYMTYETNMAAPPYGALPADSGERTPGVVRYRARCAQARASSVRQARAAAA